MHPSVHHTWFGNWLMVVCLICLGSVGEAVAQTTEQPPCDTPEYRQFDFWVGEWDVTTVDGRMAGRNRIEAILGGCVLQENWTGNNGSAGKSFNIYSAADGQWHQTWVDASGLLLKLEGGLRDGKMVLSADMPAPDGGTTLNEISWERLDEGRVRQHWRSSTDGGRTWTDVFVGIYTERS